MRRVKLLDPETEPTFFTLFHFRPMLVFHGPGNTRKHVLFSGWEHEKGTMAFNPF